MTNRPDTTTGRPGLLPWPAIALLIGIAAAVLIPSFLIFEGAAPAAIPGLIAGVFGAILSPRRSLPWPLIVGAVCVGLMVLFPSKPALWGIAAILSLSAGVEASATGGRSGIMALFLATALALIPAMPGTGVAVFPRLSPWRRAGR